MTDITTLPLIIPPALPGSLGDAAMISAAAAFLAQNSGHIPDLMYGRAWPLDSQIHARIPAERFFYRGSRVQQWLIARRLRRYDAAYFIGADVIDGAYNPPSVERRLWTLAKVAARTGKARILGASFNTKPEPRAIDALRRLPPEVIICARDPLSKGRMEAALDRPIRLVADLAFLLAPRPESPEAIAGKAWIALQHKEGRAVIAVNINYLQVNRQPDLIDAYVVLMNRLLEAGMSLLLVPHDTRSATPDQMLLEKAATGCGAGQAARMHMFPPRSPGAVKAVLEHVDLLFTGRMHAAVLALGAKTPVVCLSYQDKFEGLAEYFDLREAEIIQEPEDFTANPGRVTDLLLDHIRQQKQLRRRIEDRLEAVIDLARLNFQ